MPRLMVVVLLALLGASGSRAWAGNECCGGGDVVWREDGSKPVLLDYYVGLELGYIDGPEDLAMAMGPATEPAATKARRIVARIARFDPALGRRAKALLKDFLERALRVEDEIEPIDDENLEVSIDADAFLYQAARWCHPEGSTHADWLINDTIWRQLDNVQRAGLLLHEVFFVLHAERVGASPNRPLNPRYLRQFIASVSSMWLTEAPQDEWEAMMAALDLF